MASPEGRGGQPPGPEQPGERGEGRGLSKEGEQPPYYLAARYRHPWSAKLAYDQAQDLIFNDERADLSVYRFQLDRINHVAAVGAAPPEEVDEKLRTILSQGEPASLPSEVVKALQERRTQMQKRGVWVEGHYRPGKKLDY